MNVSRDWNRERGLVVSALHSYVKEYNHTTMAIGSRAPQRAKILADPLDHVTLMSPPFGVTGSPVTPVSM
jgi:hypothetical protein